MKNKINNPVAQSGGGREDISTDFCLRKSSEQACDGEGVRAVAGKLPGRPAFPLQRAGFESWLELQT